MPVQLGRHRVLHPGRWRWARALAWLGTLFFLTAAAFGLPLQWAVDRNPEDAGGPMLLAVLAACLGALGAYALSVRLGEGRGARELAVRPAAAGLTVGAGLGLAMMALVMAVLRAGGLYDITVTGAAAAPWAATALAVQAAVTEELWMRALLLRLLWRAFGPLPAFLGSAMIFGALHLANPGAGPMAAASVTMAGLLFCALYALTGRIWVPIGLHAAWNLAQGYLFGAVVSGGNLGAALARSTPRPTSPTWLTGGAFGPEASVVALVVIGVVTAATLLLALRQGRFHG